MMTNNIQSNLVLMKSLSDKVSHPELLEVHTMPYLASYSIVIIESDDGISRAYVKLLPFQKPEPESPTFELYSQEDNQWFQFFHDQFERLWTASTKV